MKRIGNIYQHIVSMDNLRLAEKYARKGKRKQSGVIHFRRNAESNLRELHKILVNQTYTTSQYHVFKIHEPKEREIYRLPYFPDRITHHAIMNILEPIFVATFTADTYSCIKGKGIHAASYSLRNALRRDPNETKYCLKLDIRKFYPSIDHAILKKLLRGKLKDKELLCLLDEIIDSAPGLPIGNYLSQYLANFYLTYFDHYLKEELKVKYYFRYCDDLVFLASEKIYLHRLLELVQAYLSRELHLEIKPNYRVFPTWCGIDFVGYVHYPTHTLLRKSIKENMARAVSQGAEKSVASYYGWAKHCNSINLLNKFNMKKFSELGIKPSLPALQGDKIKVDRILNREIIIHGFQLNDSKYDRGNGKCLYMQIEVDGEKRVLFSGSGVLMDTIRQIPKEDFPFETTIVKENERFQFT